jgi:hypothetical protein
MMKAPTDGCFAPAHEDDGCGSHREEVSMETVRLQTVIGPDGKVCVEVPSGFPPGPAEVLVVSRVIGPAGAKLRWRDYYGLGKEIWKNQDAQAYVNRLRDEWDP